MKIAQILEFNEAFKNVVDNEQSHINALVKFKFLSMMKQFEPCVKSFNEIRDQKIMEYGTLDEENGVSMIKSDDTEAITKFEKDINEILASEYDGNIVKFKPEDIIDKGLPADFLMRIYDLIEE